MDNKTHSDFNKKSFYAQVQMIEIWFMSQYLIHNSYSSLGLLQEILIIES